MDARRMRLRPQERVLRCLTDRLNCLPSWSSRMPTLAEG